MKPQPSEANLNRFQNYIMIEGKRKDKLELEGVKDQIKTFFDNDYERTFTIFPPMIKKPKNYMPQNSLIKNKNASKVNDEESKTDHMNSLLVNDDD